MAKYNLYVMKADDWTSALDATHDYIKVHGDNIYFLSSKRGETAEKAKVVPSEVEPWLAECQAELLAISTQKSVEKAKEKLVQDFKDELNDVLAKEQDTEGGG